MIPADEIISHLAALAKVWLLVCFSGLPMVCLLPRPMDRRDILASAPLLGIAWWAAALYIFPYEDGLWWAMGFTVVFFIAWRIFGPRKLRIFRVKKPLAGILMLIGAISYLTPIFTQHVPTGSLASDHAAGARIISASCGLADSSAPIAPGEPFNAANSGIPTLAAMSVMLGSTPLSAVMAVQHVVVCGVMLGMYLLMRMIAGRVPSAIMALVGVWISGSVGMMFFTGESSSIAVYAMGLISARMFVDFSRHNKLLAIFPLAICMASIPMFNVLTAIGWAQGFLPVVLLAGVLCTRTKFQTFSAMMPFGAVLLALLYLNFMVVKYDNMEQVVQSADVALGVNLAYSQWRIDAGYMFNHAGLLVMAMFVVFLGVILIAKRWLVLVLAAVFVAVLIAGLDFWIQRGVSLFHPRQYLFWVLPIGFMITLIGWHLLQLRVKWWRRLSRAAVIVLLAIGLAKNVGNFQIHAIEPQIGEDSWAALKWIQRNAASGEGYLYVLGSAGRFIPAMSSLPAWYTSSKAGKHDKAEHGSRQITHVFMDEKWSEGQTARGLQASSIASLKNTLKDNATMLVFASGGVKIYRIYSQDQ